MIPTITNQAPPSPPRRHAHYTTPLFKMGSFEDFLALKGQTVAIQSPCPSKLESASQLWSYDVEKDHEASKEAMACSKASQCSESGKYIVIKQEIAIPSLARTLESSKGLDNSGEKIFKQYKAQLGYRRFDYTKTLLNNDVYEATDRDIKFLSELNKEILNGCPEVTLEQFEKIIVTWEHETQEDIIISLDEALSAAIGSLDITIEDVLILTKIYEYWKTSRELFRRPLMRKYWKAANNEEMNPNIAFQRRKENRFARRRSQRMTSPLDDLKRMKTLKKNLDKGRTLMANVQYKEMMKLELQELRKKTFEEQIKQELGEDFEIPLSCGTGTNGETYLDTRKKMQEYMKKGESTLKSLKRIKQGALSATKKTYKKHSINSVDTSSSIIQEELQPTTFKPMPFVLNKLSSYLPRQIQGTFTLPIRKCSIEIDDLKNKLKQSLGSLYKRDQEELIVKVDVGEASNSLSPQDELSSSSPNNCEELMIKVEMEEREENKEDKVIQTTIVRYSISFHEGLQNKTPLLEMVPKEPIKFEPNFQPRSDLNVELSSLKKNNSVGKELVKLLSPTKEGLSAGKNSSGEGEIHC